MRIGLALLLTVFCAAVWAQPSDSKSTDASKDNQEQQQADSESAPDGDASDKEKTTPDIDFKPSEEISEDFPVPLPSDI